MKNEKLKQNKIVCFTEKPTKNVATLSDIALRYLATEIADKFIEIFVKDEADAIFIYKNNYYDFGIAMDRIFSELKFVPIFSDNPTEEEEKRYNFFYELIYKEIDNALFKYIIKDK